MHDAAALMLEAAVNSIEAGAAAISVSVSIRDGMADIRVEDDGTYTLSGDPFRDGSTTKGEGRGRGLHIIYERSAGRCRLTRGDGMTVLEFSIEDDGSFCRLDEALLPLLGLDAGITVRIRKGERDIVISRSLLEERDAVPDRAAGIRRFRNLIRSLEKGDIYG